MSRIDPDTLEPVGVGLQRPECVLCTAGGALFVSDWRGGVTRIAPDGRQTTWLAQGSDAAGLKPNGIELCSDGSFLVANLGEAGGVWRLDRSGRLEPFLLEVDGEPVPPANFVALDGEGRAWITVSTRLRPRSLGYRSDVADGFIALVDARGARIVADGLGYTNELAVGNDAVYVNETFARRLSRLPLRGRRNPGPRETLSEFGPGTFPDGVCLDEDGHCWVTSIVSNRVVRVSPEGDQQLLLEDSDSAHVAVVEAAFREGRMDASHLGSVGGARLGNVSSLAFGGPGLRTAYLGCLLADHVVRFRAPVAGRRLPHWRWA